MITEDFETGSEIVAGPDAPRRIAQQIEQHVEQASIHKEIRGEPLAPGNRRHGGSDGVSGFAPQRIQQ